MASINTDLPRLDDSGAVPAAKVSTSPTATGTGTGSAIDSSAADPRGAGLHSGLTPSDATPGAVTPMTVHNGAEPIVPAEGGILGKAKEMAKPYLEQADKAARPYIEKAQAAAQPYTDAAVAKATELKGQFDRPKEGVANVGTTGSGIPVAQPATSTTSDLGEKAKGMFGFGLATLKSAYTQVGQAIDEKTATPEKPGLFTQASTAIQHGVQQIEKAVAGEPHASSAGDTSAAGSSFGAAAPGAGAGAGAGGLQSAVTPGAAGAGAAGVGGGATSAHPIPTTTNTIAHNSNDSDPK